jgi:hypothetical protein
MSKEIRYIHSDEPSILWRVRVSENTRKYTPVNWGAYKSRVLAAYLSQDFSAIQFLLVKTGKERYYPLPSLLNLKKEVPYFAEQKLKEVIEALEWEYGDIIPL